jgi:mono/diheme cytochrome c family protein
MTFKFSSSVARSWPHWLAAGAVVLSACASATIEEPDAKDARWAATRWPGTSVSDLKGGRSLFVSRCASCHGLPEPTAKTPDQWANVIDEMAPRARLAPGDRDAVLRYLSAASERLRQGG